MEKQFQSPLKDRQRLKRNRDAIKAVGGQEYQELLAKERAQRLKWRLANPELYREHRRRHEKNRRHTPAGFKTELTLRARGRARKTGLDSSIRTSDLYWPTHCPVLGLELDYSTPRGKRLSGNPNSPSLDRWDNTKGYVPGNVYVISYKANALKGNATAEELAAVAKYALHGLPGEGVA
jgi:hypothetical protein